MDTGTSSIVERSRRPIDIAIGDGTDHSFVMMTAIETSLEGGGKTGFAYVAFVIFFVFFERTNYLWLTLKL